MPFFFTLNTSYNLPSIILSHIKRYSSRTAAHNLKVLFATMPKEIKHTAVLKKQREKLKEKGQKYIPGTVTIKVLGSGAKGAPRSLYVFTDQSRYLFNCGEGTQRLAHEHKMKLSKLEHIFITHPSWENIGGLPGVALTIQDVGVPEITIHGPAGINEIFAATRRFVILRDLSVLMANCTPENHFEDNVLKVYYVPIAAKQDTSNSVEPNGNELVHDGKACDETEGSDDDVDYYAHERKHKRRKSGDRERKRVCRHHSVSPRETAVSMCYVCKLKSRPGALCLERCVERGVPPGPLLGILKSGQDVVLGDGTVVKSADVRLPDDPGPLFIVVECPTVEYVDSLISNPTFHQYQASAKSEDDVAHLVVHFSPPEVMEDPRYKSWMEKFYPSTHHLVLNEENNCMGSIAVHRIQHKLHLLHPKIFPLLKDSGIAIKGEDHSSEKAIVEEKVGIIAQKDLVEDSARTCALTTINGVCNKHSRPGIFTGVSLVRGKTFYAIHLRPKKMLDRQDELSLDVKEFVDETYRVDGFTNELSKFHNQLSRGDIKAEQPFPQVVFLGTGSSIPNKTRNTSGILLHTSENSCILLDCGEGTYGQIVRFYGPEEVDKVMCKMHAVYVSHLHADHHIGLIAVLKGRRKALNNAAAQNLVPAESVNRPLFLLAPKQIKSWLSLYHRCFEPILDELELIPNGDLDLMGSATQSVLIKTPLIETLGMNDISTVLVKHCPNAFGVAFKHSSGWKMTYSGDTMPCPQLVALGQESDLLIHEATMEDDLENEARMKLHSTTTQAIDMGREMKAKFILLTHFSQRYAKLPRLNDNFTSNVGIAFDNMQVGFSDLPLLPLLYPSLKLMFAEHYEEMEQKAARRLMKQEREREYHETQRVS